MEQLLTIEGAADLSQMTPRLMEQQIRSDFMACVRVGNEVRIEPDTRRDYIENQKAVTSLMRDRHLRATD